VSDTPHRPSPGPTPRASDEALTEPYEKAGLRIGQILGDRYRVERLLGRGGMGTVWQAFDLKLCVEVALKALHPIGEDARRRELLRHEVRSAREVMSPNVCRIFDLIEIDGQELVSMEYVDGTHLADFLRQEGAPGLRKISEIAVQLLAGLQAIHDAGLVHRDLKPENVMLTPAGRVVLMDFGIAKAIAEGGHGTVAGTPAYMAPEQLRGERVDARTDVYAAGLVLGELAYWDHLSALEGWKALWQAFRQDPPQLPEGPWHDVLQRALAIDPDRRYPSARVFARALEEVTLRVGGKEERSPFPGLASFTEADREFFFGREADVEAIGKKLKRLHMLAIVGPSGVGKSSFLRAGLIPSLPKRWAHVTCTPGPSPLISLGQALIPQLAGDTEAMRAFLRFGEADVAVSMFTRWRRNHEDAVLIVDQFEELFTQSPKEVQERFAELLGRLPIEADVRVVLSMRDDFLFHCHAHPGLRPILTDLTLLTPIRGVDLRRVLVQPAMACGFRFEDDALLDQMVAEVESERGALPLLAFTAARLWEHRDRERGLLTTAAYESLGGVAGSLAQHAESILERIGVDREPIVREIFRNLTTGQGTRVSREREELLSVFEDRTAAGEVLAQLIDARLLTSFEVTDPNDPSTRRQRVEIVHESLLTKWPRLVRWQSQDADGALLRDQLRQAAQLWSEHGRPDDMLWTGTVFQEFRLWRERYPGGLTSMEEAFSSAMVMRAKRAQRRRRTILVSAFATLLVVLGIVGTLWQRSERAQKRAESGKLYALAQRDQPPSDAFAYTLAAMELSDQPEYRRLGVKTMLRGPIPFQLPVRPDSHNPYTEGFSPDGKWFVIGWSKGGGLQLYSTDGGEPRELKGHTDAVLDTQFSKDSKLLVTTATDTTVRLWSMPNGQLLRTLRLSGIASIFLRGEEERLFTCELIPGEQPLWKSWSLDGGEGQILGRVGAPVHFVLDYVRPDIDPSGSCLALPIDREVCLYSLQHLDRGPVRVLGQHDWPVTGVLFGPSGDLVASDDNHGNLRLWSVASGSRDPVLQTQGTAARFDPTGSRLAVDDNWTMKVWSLHSPGSARTTLLTGWGAFSAAFHPDGGWLVTASDSKLVDAWPLGGVHSVVLDTVPCHRLTFAPDGSWVAAACPSGDIKLWPLDRENVGVPRTVFHADDYYFKALETDDQGRYLFASVHSSPAGNSTLLRISLETGRVDRWMGAVVVKVDASGRWMVSNGEAGWVRVWDGESGRMTQIGAKDERVEGFSRDGRLLTTLGDSLFAWNVESWNRQLLDAALGGQITLCPDRERFLVQTSDGHLILRRIDGAESRQLTPIINPIDLCYTAVDRACSIVVLGWLNGDVEIIRTSSNEVQRLPVHDGIIYEVAIDPQGRWIASVGNDGLILTPIPTGPPFQTLPREEFLSKLRSMTNLRAVKDDTQPTGYVIRASGMPDWQHPPRW